MNINIKFPVLPERMRYKTCGDHREKFDGIEIEVVDCGDRRSEFAVAVHELIESFLCKHAGVTTEQIDAWDFARQEDDEPGDNPDAPYHAQHEVAMRIEREVVDALGLEWDAHNATLDAAWERIPASVPDGPR